MTMATMAKRTFALCAASGALLAGGALAATPAQAGGGNDVTGSTYELCEARLDVSMEEARARGNRVYNVHRCVRASSGVWYGWYDMTSG